MKVVETSGVAKSRATRTCEPGIYETLRSHFDVPSNASNEFDNEEDTLP